VAIFAKLISAIRNKSGDTQVFTEIETQLQQADLGVSLSKYIVEKSRAKSRDSDLQPEEAVKSVLKDLLVSGDRNLIESDSGLNTIVIIGVNGTGKTTFAAKLAKYLIDQKSLSQNSFSQNVWLAACDTFRAAAVAQLKTWAERLKINFVSGADNSDPASVAFSAVKQIIDSNLGVNEKREKYLIVDTAGRLHTNKDLLAELEKIIRTISKLTTIQEVLLVIDGSTGQNALSQAKLFLEKVTVTGLVLTKMDGQGSGGTALAIESQLKIPIKFIGNGEAVDDLAPFNAESYLSGVLQA
jgi:fused signal recognition particle receptor